MTVTLAKGAFATWLHANGYWSVKDLGDGRYACLMRLMFTTAIITGRWGDEGSYDDRWCFRTPEMAKAALEAWDGTGEPEGWHRHPDTGRRNPPDPFEKG